MIWNFCLRIFVDQDFGIWLFDSFWFRVRRFRLGKMFYFLVGGSILRERRLGRIRGRGLCGVRRSRRGLLL